MYSVSVSMVCKTASNTVTVFDKCEFSIYIPNAFAPNNDGKTFGSMSSNISTFLFTILKTIF